MNAIRLTFVLLMTLILTSCKKEGEGEIRDVFDAYNAALRNNDGATAVSIIDDKYFETFEHVLIAARSASREKVFRMRPSERADIAAMRNRLSREELKSLDARGAIKMMIDRGIENRSDFDISLGRITFKSPRAFAPLWIEGMETKFRLEFIRADNIWKLDPACLDESVDSIIVRRASRTGKREDSLILDRESQSSGKKVGDEIWDPPR